MNTFVMVAGRVAAAGVVLSGIALRLVTSCREWAARAQASQGEAPAGPGRGAVEVAPARYVPLVRTDEESLGHFGVVREAERIVRERAEVLLPLYEDALRRFPRQH